MKRSSSLTPWIVAAAVLLALYLVDEEGGGITAMLQSDKWTADKLPPDPAGRRAAANEAITTVFGGDAAGILLGQGVVETANFGSKEFPLCLSIWNRHVGSGKYGDWNGKVCMIGPDGNWTVYDNDAAATQDDPSYAKEHLRCFDSLEQCARDLQGLLGLSMYADAAAALQANDPRGYAAAIAKGDGTNGFVGDPTKPKAAAYTAALTNQYVAMGIA